MSAITKQLGGCLLAAAAMLTVPGASAAALTSASASLSDLKLTLIDLAPDDGIDPVMYTLGSWVTTYSQRIFGPAPAMDFENEFTSTEVVQQTGWARTQIDPVNATASAEASNLTSWFQAANMRGLRFWLSPNTRIEISAVAQANEVDASGVADRGYAIVYFDSSLYDRNEVPFSEYEFIHGRQYGQGTKQMFGVLESADDWTGGVIRYQTNVAVNTAPVPEPSTWAMLLAGFGLVGWRARRSRV